MKKFLMAVLLAGLASLQLAAENESWFAKKFPEKLITANGKEVDTATALNGKMVALYFSASWCGPCKAFTPHLVKFYKKNAKANNFAVVFISRDKNAAAMKAYMKSAKMPWYAVPFNGSTRDDLAKELKVRGIPTLVLFDANGKLVSENIRWDVMLLGNKAFAAWKSPDYQPLTYQDYKEKAPKSKKSRKKKK